MTTTGSGSNSSARMNLDDLELELRRLPGVRSTGFTESDDVLLIQLQVSGEQPPANLPLQATRIAYRHSAKPVALEVVRWRVVGDAYGAIAVDAPADARPGPGAETPGAAEAGSPVAPAPPLDDEAAVDETAPGAEGDDLSVDANPAVPIPTSPGMIPFGQSAPEEPGDRWPRVRLLAVLTFPDTDELEVHLTYGGRRIIGRAVASTGMLAVVEAMVDGLRIFAPGLELRPSWARVLDDDHGRDVHVVACELTAADESRRLGIASGASAIEAAARATLHALNRSISQHLAETGGVDEG